MTLTVLVPFTSHRSSCRLPQLNWPGPCPPHGPGWPKLVPPLTTGVSGAAFAGPDPVTSMAATAGPAQHANSIILAPNRIILSSVGEALFLYRQISRELLLGTRWPNLTTKKRRRS